MSFMDIMNIMQVSSFNFRFSLIAIAALFVVGSGYMAQDAYGALTFTAIHNTTTQTDITFSHAVNGTLVLADWRITVDGTSNGTGTSGVSFADKVTLTGITNSSSHPVASGIVTGNTNWINSTIAAPVTQIYIHHAAVASDATMNVNFTFSESVSGVVPLRSTGLGWVINADGNDGSDKVFLVKAYDAESDDEMIPTAVSADIIKSNPSQVRILMSEPVVNINSTGFKGFTMTTTGGGNAAVPATMLASNGTSYIYVNLQSPALFDDTLTIAYDTEEDGTSGNHWITDSTNSQRYGMSNQLNEGHGNRLGNFTAISIVNYIQIGDFDSNSCYDCSAPIVTNVQVSLDSSDPITVTNDNPVQINAGIGNTISIMVTVADNHGAIPFAGLYTNFGDTPDNLYYSNNFDGLNQKSTSYYEWNARGDDTAFGNTDAITWAETTTTVNPNQSQTFTYTMTINDEIESTQVWVDLGDASANYAKSSLPITLEVAGAPSLTFASDDTQTVVSYFNESILLALVSQWVTTSSDDSSNVAQLTSVLGIDDPLPTWTTSLASWVADDRIDVADMIVAVEYVINQ